MHNTFARGRATLWYEWAGSTGVRPRLELNSKVELVVSIFEGTNFPVIIAIDFHDNWDLSEILLISHNPILFSTI